MPRAKIAIFVTATALVLFSAAASSASANWFVGGTQLTGSAAVASTAKVDSFVKFNLPIQKIKIECTGAITRHVVTRIEILWLILYESLQYEGCKVVEPANCSLEEPTLPTVPLVGTLTLATSPADRVQVAPRTGKQIATLNFSETACSLTGSQPIKGSYTLALPTGQTEEVAQAFTGLGSTENNSLEVGAGNKLFIEGGASLLTLASGSKWSFK